MEHMTPRKRCMIVTEQGKKDISLAYWGRETLLWPPMEDVKEGQAVEFRGPQDVYKGYPIDEDWWWVFIKSVDITGICEILERLRRELLDEDDTSQT